MKASYLILFTLLVSSSLSIEYIPHSVSVETTKALQWTDQDCYPWMFRNETNGACECSDIPYRAVLCDPTIPRTSILDCYCMTYNSERNETELGRCLSGCGHKIDSVYYTLPLKRSDLNTYTCGQTNRASSLCGKCKPGYSPLVYSYELKCMKCTGMTYNWIKYVAVAYIPLTFFFLLVVIAGFSGTSPGVRSFISVSQCIASPINVRAYLSVVENKSIFEPFTRAVVSIYSIWNLDFFRAILPPICLNINHIQALFLDYAIAFYPLFLVVITAILIRLHSRDVRILVYLWRPFHKLFHSIQQDWSHIQGSAVKAFATFFLLSYLKVLNVTADLLVYTKMYTLPMGEQSYKVKFALYYDASVEYFRGDHRYYGTAAILIGLLFVILPVVFLVVYPMRWFQKCLNRFKIQRQSIDIFINCYQGHYKDGTNGTKDCRCFSIVFFFGQIILVAIFVFSKSSYFYPIGNIVMIVFMFIVLATQPYKEQFKVYSLIDSFMFLAMAIAYTLIIAADEANIKAAAFSTPTHILLAILSLVPLLYIVALSIWWIFVKRKIHHKLRCFRPTPSYIQLEDSCDNDFPDRIEHPRAYQAQAAPLLSVNNSKSYRSSMSP